MTATARTPAPQSHLVRNLGWALLAIGTIVGSLGGAKLPTADWRVAGLGIGLVVIAGMMLRFARARAQAGTSIGDEAEVLAAMRALPGALDALVREAPGLALAEIAGRLAKLDRDYFATVADGAPRLLTTMGVTRYADIFGGYASGERSIARAWSAASDHHRPETLASLELGATRIRDAVARLDS